MGIFDKTTKPLFIQRPDEAKAALIYKHPDQNIPYGAQLTVDSDEVAVFFRDGIAIGRMGAGRHTLDTGNVPFLAPFVNKVTGGNVFLAEVFFISTREFAFELNSETLGTMIDANSHQMVDVEVKCARFTLRVSDLANPQKLITGLGGQRANAGAAILSLVRDRLLSGIRNRVMWHMEAGVDVLDLIGNLRTPAIGAEVLQEASGEFAAHGVRVERFVRLDLGVDAASLARLKEYQAQISAQDLEMRKASGMSQIAGSYVNYQLATGQGDALRGLGQGLSHGGGAAPAALGYAGIGMGLGLGSAMGGMLGQSLQPPIAYAVPQPPAPPNVGPTVVGSSRASSGTPTWLMRTSDGNEGPYPPRQIALQIAQRNLDPADVMVWSPSLPSWMPAAQVPAVMGELRKRQSAPVDGGVDYVQAFERRCRQLLAQGAMSAQEVEELVELALRARPTATLADCRALVVGRAHAANVTLEPPPMPNASGVPAVAPPLPVLYSYSDGSQQIPNLSAHAVAQRCRTEPNGAHFVWRPGMATWMPAQEVEAIHASLEAQR